MFKIMLTALNELGEKVYATISGEKATCIGCGGLVIGRKNPVNKGYHFYHKVKCIYNHEAMSEWHMDWQSHFDKKNTEVRHVDRNGVLHISDIYTDKGVCIEFQNSPISKDELKQRSLFYKKLIWVFNSKLFNQLDISDKEDKGNFTKYINYIWITNKTYCIDISYYDSLNICENKIFEAIKAYGESKGKNFDKVRFYDVMPQFGTWYRRLEYSDVEIKTSGDSELSIASNYQNRLINYYDSTKVRGSYFFVDLNNGFLMSLSDKNGKHKIITSKKRMYVSFHKKEDFLKKYI